MKRIFQLLFVFSSFCSCDDIIEEPDISKETVLVLAPTNGSVVDTTLVNFSWQILNDAASYRVQVAKPTFSNASQILLDTLIQKTEVSKLLENDVYEWRVKALNSGYETVYTIQNFTVSNGD